MSYTKTTWVDNTTPINETNLNKIESGIKNNDINIGEENYDNTKTYEVGDIVRYNEKIYKCITAITTAENFDISKWEQTNIVEIVQSEKSKIYELIEAISTPIVGEGENITLNDTAEKRFENFDIEGNSEQEGTPSPDYPSEVKSCGDNGSINEVICNKNLFDKDKLDKTYFSIDSNDNITSLVADNRTFTNIEAIANVIEGKKYTLSCENIVTGSIQIAYTLDNIVIDRKYNTKKISFTAPKTGSIAFKILNVTYPYVLGKIQIEEGIETTDYIEHQSQTYTIPVQQPMRAIGDIRDKFILKENGKWYERHFIARKILDGTESINTNEFGTNSFTFTLTNIKIKDDKKLSISNYFKGVKEKDRGNSGNNIIYSASPNDIFIRNTNFANLADFKSWLSDQYNAGTPVYVDYVLATPTDIECTSQQTEILNQIYIKAKSYKGVTHIYSNDDVSPNCYVEAVKDLTTLIQ